MVVSSGASGPLEARRLLTSVDILPSERIENLVPQNNWELFGQVPGVMLTQFGQGTTSGKFSMRAFNGEGEINAVKLLIDGVPSNSNDGNMPYIDLAPRLDIESIEVVRGTNDPRYGLHNIAGNANISTKSGGNYLLGRATVGSFATGELQAAAGIQQNIRAVYIESGSAGLAVSSAGVDEDELIGLLVRQLIESWVQPSKICTVKEDHRNFPQIVHEAEKNYESQLDMAAELIKERSDKLKMVKVFAN